MRRRSLITSFAALSVLSGCSGSPRNNQTMTTTEEQSSTPTTTTTAQTVQQLAVGEIASIGEGAARIYAAEATRTIITLDGIHFGIAAEPDAQFLKVAMTTKEPVDGHIAARQHTILELDGTQYSTSDHRFHPAPGGGFNIAYRVPLKLTATTGRIIWQDDSNTVLAAWTLPEGVIQKLNNPPSFAVHGFTVPEEASSADPFDVEIIVENTGASAGEFKALIGKSSSTDSTPYEWSVPRGERKTVTAKFQIIGEPGESRTIYLDWGLGRLERTITISK